MKQKEREIYSVALVIHDTDSNILCGLRDELEVHDYKGFWSIPSTTVEKEEYYSLLDNKQFSDNVTQAFVERIGAKIAFEEVLISGERIRSSYHLFQLVIHAKIESIPSLRTRKYKKLEYLSPTQIVQRSDGSVGTCISLYFQYLIDNRLLPSTFEYREVTPEIAVGSIIPENMNSAMLWKIAAPNYALLLAGKTGTDGASIRSLSLDRYVASLEKQWAWQGLSVLDVGCGDGALLERLLVSGIDAWGIELNMPSRNSAQSHIMCGEASEAKSLFKEKKFNVIFANLVFEWVEDLELTLGVLRQCLASNGRIIATFTVPEFSHAGRWLNEKDKASWLQEKSPRRSPELVMINRCVGPVRYYSRGTDQIITLGATAGLCVCGMNDIYLDTTLDEAELTQVLVEKPQLARHLLLPMFRAIEFTQLGLRVPCRSTAIHPREP